MEFFLVYDTATGEVRWRGQGPAGTAQIQQPGDGLAVAVVPKECIVGDAIDLEPLKAALIAAIDDRAEALRARFLTPGSGQAMTYLRKEAEARAWTEGADPAAFPFLSTEAAATGVTPADLVAEVLILANGWVAIGSQLDAIRIKAKQDVREAANLLAILAAGNVDWSPIETAAASA